MPPDSWPDVGCFLLLFRYILFISHIENSGLNPEAFTLCLISSQTGMPPGKLMGVCLGYDRVGIY